jgi:hypothetical protein
LDLTRNDIALYYPYIHFRDEQWLKSSLLYWPRIARLVPAKSGPRDSSLVRELCDSGLVIDAHAGSATALVSAEFARFVEKYSGSLANSYALDRQVIVSATTVGSRSFDYEEAALQTQHVSSAAPLSHKAAQLDYVWIDEGAMTETLVRRLEDLNLVERRLTRDGTPWLAMNRHLAAVYKCALADMVARKSDMQVITDQPREHVVVNGWTVEAIAHTLLRGDSAEPVVNHNDVAETFAMFAIKTVVPNLAGVGFREILDIRRRLEPEFIAFRRFVAGLSDALAEITAIEDPAVRTARLEILYSGEIEPKIHRLERDIRSARLEPISALLSLKTLAPPAIVGAASAQLGLNPLATAAGTVAACLISSLSSMRTKVENERSDSPAAYLLGLRRRLTPHRSVQVGLAVFGRQKLLS